MEVTEESSMRMGIKTVQFSTKPWRYERCIVLEEDLDVVMTNLKQFKNKPRIPHRVVMNNHTFSIFENFDYNTVMSVWPLQDIEVKNSKSSDCIIVFSKVTKAEFEVCTIQMYEGDHIKKIQQWKERIDFFQKHCMQNTPVISSAVSGDTEDDA